MNKYTAALCYFSEVVPTYLEAVRARISLFGYRAEYLVESVANRDGMGRSIIQLGRGYDLVVVVTDGARHHVEFDFLGHFNHIIEDPWATLVVATNSPSWLGYQTVIAIESERYLGHFLSEDLPANLFGFALEYRCRLYDRGLSEKEWGSIQSYVDQKEWGKIGALRKI